MLCLVFIPYPPPRISWNRPRDRPSRPGPLPLGIWIFYHQLTPYHLSGEKNCHLVRGENVINKEAFFGCVISQRLRNLSKVHLLSYFPEYPENRMLRKASASCNFFSLTQLGSPSSTPDSAGRRRKVGLCTFGGGGGLDNTAKLDVWGGSRQYCKVGCLGRIYTDMFTPPPRRRRIRRRRHCRQRPRLPNWLCCSTRPPTRHAGVRKRRLRYDGLSSVDTVLIKLVKCEGQPCSFWPDRRDQPRRKRSRLTLLSSLLPSLLLPSLLSPTNLPNLFLPSPFRPKPRMRLCQQKLRMRGLCRKPFSSRQAVWAIRNGRGGGGRCY